MNTLLIALHLFAVNPQPVDMPLIDMPQTPAPVCLATYDCKGSN